VCHPTLLWEDRIFDSSLLIDDPSENRNLPAFTLRHDQATKAHLPEAQRNFLDERFRLFPRVSTRASFCLLLSFNGHN